MSNTNQKPKRWAGYGKGAKALNCTASRLIFILADSGRSVRVTKLSDTIGVEWLTRRGTLCAAFIAWDDHGEYCIAHRAMCGNPAAWRTRAHFNQIETRPER